MAVFGRKKPGRENKPTKQSPLSWQTTYAFAAAIAVVPSLVYFSSMHGYLDLLYEYTIGVPSKDNRALVSVVLAFLAVNIVVVTFLGKAFDDPLEVDRTREAKMK